MSCRGAAGSSGCGRTWRRPTRRPRLPISSRPRRAHSCGSRIVAADRLPLIDEDGLARLAADAWSLVHAWGAGGASWRGWSGGDDDQQAFVRWADQFAARMGAANAVDPGQLPDWLAHHATRVPAWRGASVTLAGFIEASPQQQRLRRRAHGCRDERRALSVGGRCARLGAAGRCDDPSRRDHARAAVGARPRAGRSRRDDRHRDGGSRVATRGDPRARRRDALSRAAMAGDGGGGAAVQPLARCRGEPRCR